MPVKTLGQKLREAREIKGLTLEEAARATRIRAIRLAEIEHDIYGNCPSATYARGFAVIYGDFLGVDVTPHLHEFDVSGSVGLDDYQYLSHQSVAEASSDSARSLSRKRTASPARRRFTTVALVVVLAITAVFGWVVYVNYQRLGNLDELHARNHGQNLALGSAGPTTNAASSAVELPQEPALLDPVVESPAAASSPAPAILPTPTRGTEQGTRNAIFKAPPQPRPDLFE